MLPADLVIRPARPEDGKAVQAMAVALSADEGSARSPFTAARFRRDGFGPAPAFVAFIAERGGEAVGYTVGFRDYDTDRLRRSVYMADLYVHDSVRGAGVARALTAALARHARQSWGAEVIAWGVLAPNARARRFYAKLGAAEQQGQLVNWIPPRRLRALARSAAESKGAEIRPAGRSDARAIAGLLEALLVSLSLPLPESMGDRLAADGFGPRPMFEALIAERDGAPVGYALYWPAYDTDVPGRGTMLSDLYVAPEARRHGVALALMTAMAARTVARSGRFVFWFVDEDNAPARAFYRRFASEWPGVIACVADGEAFKALAAG
jgi:ribosomal protein S18 acetylase RimI-like enzyme